MAPSGGRQLGEEFAIEGVSSGSASTVTVRADGTQFSATVRLDTPRERTFYQHGGILPYVVRSRLS